MTEFWRPFFHDRLISTSLRSPRGLDLNILDLFLQGTLKNKVFENTPENIDQLKHGIKMEIVPCTTYMGEIEKSSKIYFDVL